MTEFYFYFHSNAKEKKSSRVEKEKKSGVVFPIVESFTVEGIKYHLLAE